MYLEKINVLINELEIILKKNPKFMKNKEYEFKNKIKRLYKNKHPPYQIHVPMFIPINKKIKPIYKDKIVYKDRIIEKPIYKDKIVYKDRIIEKPIYKEYEKVSITDLTDKLEKLNNDVSNMLGKKNTQNKISKYIDMFSSASTDEDIEKMKKYIK